MRRSVFTYHPEKLIRSILLAVVFALTGFSLWKIYGNATFDASRVWDPDALFLSGLSFKMVLIYSVLVSIIFSALGRFSKSGYLIFLIPIIVTVCGKGEALVSVVIFSLASISVGYLVRCLFKRTEADDPFDLQVLILSWFLGLAINCYFTWIAIHFKVNYGYVYYGVLFAEILISLNYWKKFASEVKGRSLTFSMSPGQKAVTFSFVVMIIYALVPFYLCDDLQRHLYFPKTVALFHVFDFDPSFIWNLDTQLLGQCAYVISYLTGGEYSIRILNQIFFFAGCFLAEKYTREAFGSRVSLFTVLTLISTPFIAWILGVVFLDTMNFISAVVLLVMMLDLLKGTTAGKVNLYFVLAAFSYLIKQQAIFIILPTAIVVSITVILRSVGTRDVRLFLSLLSGAMLGVLVMAPLLIQNYLLTQNPLFPLFNHIFRSPLFPTEVFKGVPMDIEINWKMLYVYTFSGHRFLENKNYLFGISYFIFILFAPIILLEKKGRNVKVCLLFVFFVSSFLWIFLTSPNMRYFVGPAFSGALIIGLIMGRLESTFENNKFVQRSLQALFVLIFASNFICQFTVQNISFPFPIREALTGCSSCYFSTLNGERDSKRVFSYASSKYGGNVKCLLIDNFGKYFADFKVDSIEYKADTECVTHYLISRDILRNQDPKGLFDVIFNEYKFDFIIMRKKFIYYPLLDPIFHNKEFEAMLTNEFSVGDMGIYTPKK